MSFVYPNINFLAGKFWIRWTLVAFILINVLLAVCILIKVIWKKSITVTCKATSANILRNDILLSVLIYASTIPIYIFRGSIGNGGESAIYKIVEQLNTIESLIVILLITTLIYGFTYKNSHTFINLYFRALAVIELIYIISYYITFQTKLDQWYNWLGLILLGIIFVVLNTITIELVKEKTPQINIHDPIRFYDSLFSNRKYQANEIVSIIEGEKSESGYSICVTGEWGAGKTSLINGIYNKVKQNKSFNLYEIRINALELDDSVSLINYFFKRIESILKANSIYTGIASEYKELIASISGTIINESATKFISNKLNISNSDYRENINKLSKLLFDNLENSRILIIVDDIERCSSDKAKSYLFLIKEIATMSRCITVFLADIDELKKTCNLDESFFEKFFNLTINLAKLEPAEVLLSLTIVIAKASDLNHEIIKILNRFDNEMDKVRKEPFLYINDSQERQEYKEKRINSISNNKLQFFSDLSNPRRAGKMAEYYQGLIKQIEHQLSHAGGKQSVIRSFLDKVDYKKQISLLSIIYGFYSSEFAHLQSGNIYNYIGTFETRLKSAESHEENIYRVDSLIEDEWFHLFRTLSSDFRIQERLRFVNCVLKNIDELANTSNGYTSHEEQCISIILNGKLPENMSFPELVEMIYAATYRDLPERELLIKKVFDLYMKELGTGPFDKSFELFSHDVASNFFSSETPVLKMFTNVFCTDNCHLLDSERIKGIFISFAKGYLWRNCTTFSRYFMPVSSPERVSYETWNNTNEAVMLHDTCESMLAAYCDKCESYLDFIEDVSTISAIQRLRNLTHKVDAEYSGLESAGYCDVLELRKNVDDQIAEITCLFEIERFINKYSTISGRNSFDVRRLSNDSLALEIDKLYNELSEKIDYDRNKDIQLLLQFVYGNVGSVTTDEYEKLNNIVGSFCTEHSPKPSWRQMLIYIKKHMDDNKNSTHDYT
jgi:hypothetical protein